MSACKRSMRTTQTHHACIPVKKTLFSLAFVAASGVYVAAADHLFRCATTMPQPSLSRLLACGLVFSGTRRIRRTLGDRVDAFEQ